MEIVKMITDICVIILASGFEVVPKELSEEHLPNSDHASPPCISHKRRLISAFLQQLGKARTISNPDDVFESGCNLLVGFIDIGRIAGKLFAEKVGGLVSR
jgi:hypothetical protein